MRSRPGLHGLDRLAGEEDAVDDANVGNDAAVLVENRVEYQRPRRRIEIALRWRDALDDRLESVLHSFARLRGDLQHLPGVLAE